MRLVGKHPVPGTLRRQAISEDTALRDLEGLVSAGLLVREGAGRGVHYRVLLPDEADTPAFNADVFTTGRRDGADEP